VSNSEDLVNALWDLFRSEIATGDPVFFCFSQETMREELLSAGLECESPLQTICDAAQTCFRVYGHFAALRPEALSPISAGMSMSIVLVCQQVLAVEEMMRDRGGFSEHAYFPRLRALMSDQLPTLSINPFRFGDFERIWKQFSREIQSIEGCSSATITFKFGEYSGVNKARLFPLSQALLSRGDLFEIMRRSSTERLRAGSSNDVWHEIRRSRSYLSRRAQMLIGHAFLQEPVTEQVQRFARRLPSSASPLPESRVGLERLLLGIFIDTSDWPNEDYRAFVMLKGASTPIEDDDRVRQKLKLSLADQGYVICALSESRDFWLLEEGEVDVAPGETILVIADRPGSNRARSILHGFVPRLKLEEDRIRQLGTSSELSIAPIFLPSTWTASIKIRSGKLVKQEEPRDAIGGYVWIGGACVDARSRKYLREALPTAIRFGSREVSIRDLTRVGDAAMKWEGLEKMIGKLLTDAIYELRFPDGKVARLSVAVTPRIAGERVGYPIDSNGRLSPILERLSDSDDAVVGFSEPQATFSRAVEIHNLATLVRDLVTRSGRHLTAEESEKVWRRVESSRAPEGVKGLVRNLLKQEPTTTDSTLQRIGIVCS
jgi:hypothetical protein